MSRNVVTQCVYCGDDLDADTVTREHVIPKLRGGSDAANTAPACRDCNAAKGPLTAREFLALRDSPDDLEAMKRLVHAEFAEPKAAAARARRESVTQAAARNRATAQATEEFWEQRAAAEARFREDLERSKVAWAVEQDRRRQTIAAAETARAQAKSEGRKAGT